MKKIENMIILFRWHFFVKKKKKWNIFVLKNVIFLFWFANGRCM